MKRKSVTSVATFNLTHTLMPDLMQDYSPNLRTVYIICPGSLYVKTQDGALVVRGIFLSHRSRDGKTLSLLPTISFYHHFFLVPAVQVSQSLSVILLIAVLSHIALRLSHFFWIIFLFLLLPASITVNSHSSAPSYTLFSTSLSPCYSVIHPPSPSFPTITGLLVVTQPVCQHRE